VPLQDKATRAPLQHLDFLQCRLHSWQEHPD